MSAANFPRLVVIGAAAGGVRAVEDVVAGLPAAFPAPILVVVHLSPSHRSRLAEILRRAGPLPASTAVDDAILQAGHVYVAPPDRHLLVTGEDRMRVTVGPKENEFRPAVDVLFRSAAYYYGARAVGVMLSGSLSDGISGLYAIKRVGGTAVIQDPEEAIARSMPLAPLSRLDVDYALPAREIGLLLQAIVERPVAAEPLDAAQFRSDIKIDIDVAASDAAFEEGMMNRQPSPYTCPSCHGVLFRISEGKVDRFRCHTGHGYTAASLVDQYGVTLEETLWEAVKGLQESIALLGELTSSPAVENDADGAGSLVARMQALQSRLETLRRLTLEQGASNVLAASSTEDPDAPLP